MTTATIPFQKTDLQERETKIAVKNGLRLVVSLAISVAVAFFVRLMLPRYLGPQLFGRVHFSESLATGFFVITTLGFDTYISKEVSKNTAHASDFFGGLLIVRAGLSIVALASTLSMLWWMQKPTLEYTLVVVFAFWQASFLLNNTFIALLNANSTVGEMVLLNIISKIIWGGGVMLVIWTQGPVQAIAVCFLGSELLKSVFLYRVVRDNLNLKIRLDFKATYAIVLSSLPYFLTTLIARVYQKLDVSMISHNGWDREVGWYGAAANVSAIIILFLPLVSSVVMPMCSRIAMHESHDAMNQVMRGAVRVTSLGSVLVCLQVVLHAQDIVRLLFGPDFAPSVRTLQAIAPTFPLTYLAVLFSLQLFQLKRDWYSAAASCVGLIVNAGLNIFFIPYGKQYLGNGGAGFGAAVATLITECSVTSLLVLGLGKAAIDKHFLAMLAKLAVVCVIVAGLHYSLRGHGLWRILAEVPMYLTLVILLRIKPADDLYKLAMLNIRRIL
jgi:O-antigen/teichoic acid export membrane protein